MGTATAADLTDLDELRRAVSRCTACDLYRDAEQAVVGTGPPSARLMLIGEQPGDREDREGAPFVGPAGRVLDRALAAAGIRREDVYLTNVVKHFAHEQRGKRRIHRKPNAAEIRACRPWLDAELRLVRPDVIGLLGATAAQALLGRSFRITEQRGEVLEWEGHEAVATLHPSAVLRTPKERRDEVFDGLVADLRVLAHRLAGAGG
ncbi:UdgX family uracil-DNA binding protein [Pseudonocardia bannensis]|uniref:Type-4 uracil-DNA glycosylase n=2 Tax=Pseudonocardia bannensis TaxID=630973 RepID=A0A848DIG5_9PSEU|nr:UdgX family uracil-DNA binding protein [Pseudonocardia bannensis]